MIKLEVNNEFLVLDEDTSITITIENPFFDFTNVINSPYTFNFTVPDDTEGINRRILKYNNLISKHKPDKSFPCWFWLGNNRWMFGNLSTNYKDGVFNLGFIQLKEIIEKLKSSLNTVDTGVIIHTEDLYTGMKARIADNYSGEKDFVNYPVYNPDLFANAEDCLTSPYPANNLLIDNYGKYVNYFFNHSVIPSGEFYLIKIARAINPPPFEFYYAASPAIYLKFMLEKLFVSLGFVFTDISFFSDDENLKLTIYTNRIFLYKVLCDGFNYTVQIQLFNVFNLNDYLPNLLISDFLRSIANNFCLTYYYNFKEKKVVLIPNKYVLLSSESIDWSQKVLTKYELIHNESDGFVLKTKLSDDNLFDERVIEKFSKPYVTPVFSYNNLPNPNAGDPDLSCLVIDSQRYFYKTLMNGVLNWQPYTDDYLPKFIGNKEKSIESNADTLLRAFYVEDHLRHEYFGGASQVIWTIPESSEPNDSLLHHDQTDKTENLRLLFYRGMQKYCLISPFDGLPVYNDDVRYPYATHCHLDPSGNEIGTRSLSWNGSAGLYEKSWKETIEFLSNYVTINRKLNLTEEDILNLDLSKKILIVEPEYGSILYLIKKLVITLTLHEIEPVESELARMP